MSGYAGADDESVHAIILAENEINLARSMLPKGPGTPYCLDCGEEIPVERRKAMPGTTHCIFCQEAHDKRPQIKMLVHIL